MKNKRNTAQSGFTLIELMIVVAIIGILAAVAIPAFVKYIKKAKTAEAGELLRKMSEGARLYYLESHNGISRIFPDSTAQRPILPCCPTQKCPADATHWTTPTWKALGFNITDPHYFRYTFTATVGTPKTFTALAEADLDCDGTESSYIIYAEDTTQEEVLSSGNVIKNRPLE